MHSACHGLDQNSLFQRQCIRYMVMYSLLIELHIFCKSTLRLFFETINIMSLAHRVITRFTKTTFTARNDLFRDHTVPFLHTIHILPILHNTSHEFMPTDNRRLYVTLFRCRSPYPHTAVQSLHITGTYPASLDLHKDFILIYFRYRNILITEIPRGIHSQCFHHIHSTLLLQLF